MNEKKRGHSVTGKQKGRPKNEFGKSKKTDDMILENLHQEVEQYLSEKLGSMGEDVERYVFFSRSYPFLILTGNIGIGT
jgi:hypothetical protein